MKKTNTQGYIALTTALILSVVFLSVGIGVSMLAVSGGQNSLSMYSAKKAEIIAESCVEYALFQLQQSLEYVGNETVNIGGETCDILTIGGIGNNNRVIKTESTVSDYVRHIEVEVAEIFPEIEISSFKTVVNF